MSRLVARLAVATVALGVTAGGAALIVACGDLFHKTDFPTLCEVDAQACAVEGGPGGDGGDVDAGDGGPGGIDLCAQKPSLEAARRACAWAGSCLGPLGGNAFGACMFQALQVIDCDARPDMPAKGQTLKYWQCLVAASQAQSCDAVRRCAVPAGEQACTNSSTTPYIACLDFGQNEATRFICPPNGGSPLVVESCAAAGRTCRRTSSGTAFCVPAALPPDAGVSPCDAGCEQSALHVCGPDLGADSDIGVNCTQFGAGTCTPGGATPACTPSTGTKCSASVDVTCDGPVATACPAGTKDRVDCSRLGSTCSTDLTDPKHDVTRACRQNKVCTDDTCTGTTLTSCVYGVTYTVDCAQHGFTRCDKVDVFGNGPHAKCSN